MAKNPYMDEAMREYAGAVRRRTTRTRPYAGRAVPSGEEQVGYEEYKRRAIARGAKETASPEDYREIQKRLAGAIVRRRRKKGRGAALPQYSDIKDLTLRMKAGA